MILETERLTLRELTEGDAAFILALVKIGMTCLGLRQLEGHDEPSTYFETVG